jgi:hypothetical protein
MTLISLKQNVGHVHQAPNSYVGNCNKNLGWFFEKEITHF